MLNFFPPDFSPPGLSCHVPEKLPTDSPVFSSFFFLASPLSLMGTLAKAGAEYHTHMCSSDYTMWKSCPRRKNLRHRAAAKPWATDHPQRKRRLIHSSPMVTHSPKSTHDKWCAANQIPWKAAYTTLLKSINQPNFSELHVFCILSSNRRHVCLLQSWLQSLWLNASICD